VHPVVLAAGDDDAYDVCDVAYYAIYVCDLFEQKDHLDEHQLMRLSMGLMLVHYLLSSKMA